jgi:hypothetical protein
MEEIVMKKFIWYRLLSLLFITFILVMFSCVTLNVPSDDEEGASLGGGNPPIISAFSSDPNSITAGNIATLDWQVTGANTVSIDNGIGNVPLSGNRDVTPKVTTIYTLTATGVGGDNTATVQVTVNSSASSSSDTYYTDPGNTQSGATASLPVINSFTSSPVSNSLESFTLSWNVSNASSVSITPGIGAVDVVGNVTVTPASTTTYILSANNDYGSREKSVTVSNVVEVAHIGWLREQVAYDFIENAPSAYWYSGNPQQGLPFPGSSNSNGFVCYQQNTKLNDSVTYTRLLETHPQYVNDGYISGKYNNIYIPDGAKLKLKVGIINGASSGKVRFKIYHCCPEGNVWWNQVVAYADGVKSAEVDLSALSGQTLDYVLITVIAEGVSTQDWAAWAEAKIVY